MSKLARVAALVGIVLVASAPGAPAATPKEIDAAIQKGTAALKARYANAGALPAAGGNGNEHGLGGTCLAGLALMEAGTPTDDPAVKNITGIVRNAAYTQNNTYAVALCLIYLDRFGDPADVPLIQMLAVRLVVGQTSMGGWTYQCVGTVNADDERRLRAMKAADLPAGKLHPEVARYAQALIAGRGQAGAGAMGTDDNSNTQFAVLAVWAARKHGVPVEDTLNAVLVRFMKSQDPQTGNWSYSGPTANGNPQPGGSPAMYCAGLLGLATGVARREERRPKDPPPAAPPGGMNPGPAAPSDPFGTGGAAPPPKPQPRPADQLDKIVQIAFAGLTLTLVDQAGKGLLQANGGHGHGDLYFLWSLERACVIYGIEKLTATWNGRPVVIDWHDLGSTVIVRSQSPDGTWGVGGYGAEVNTAFAVLFLCRSNLARDLSSKVQKDPTNTELRAGRGPAATDVLPTRPSGSATSGPAPVVNLPNPTGSKPVGLASDLLKAANDSDWVKILAALRDGKGTDYTHALTIAATHAVGDRKKVVRDVLAERLCRMTPATLRAMLKADQPELRRAAALACAMKDDAGHISDLIDALLDDSDAVVRAARAGLTALTGKDFGPPANATTVQKAAAATEWRKWYAEQKK